MVKFILNINKVNMDSKFISKYVKRMTKYMSNINPDWDKNDIEKIVRKMIKEQAMNPEVTLDNNYTGESRDTTLLSVFDWILTRKPIIAGNGTFYKNQNEAINPITLMLDEWADSRKAFKAEMFKVGETLGFESHKYHDLDRNQLNEKINMNAYYGSSGAPSSAFYSKWSGPATTLTAQSVISTAETMFESFLADNYIYLDLTELLEWVNSVLKEDFDSSDDILINENELCLKSREELCDRLVKKILNTTDDDWDILYNYLLSIKDMDITRLYYKNNMIEFIKDHEYIQSIFVDILYKVENLSYADKNDEDWLQKIPNDYRQDFFGKTVKDWNKFVNKQYFMDPNKPPKSIINDLDILSNYLIKYCYTRFLSIDRIYRLRNFKRRVVTVIDTDSNFLSLDTLINYLFSNVLREDYGRDFLHNEFITVNIITFVITNAIQDMLAYYGEMCNIPADYRGRFDMKNEFFNSLLVIGKAKKRYISKQMLREGNLLSPPKADIKGFDFKKATTSEYAEKVFMNIIKKHILNSEFIELPQMIKEIKMFKNDIMNSIKNGERTFLPLGSAKELGAYKNPSSIASVRGSYAWNILYPDNTIEFPSKVSLVKMNIFTEDDIADLEKTEPEIYNTIIDKIFNDKTGMFVTESYDNGIDYVNIKSKEWYKKLPKKYQSKYKKLGPVAWNEFVDTIDFNDPKYAAEKKGKTIYKKKGLQVLAIPSNTNIPDWAKPYIDYSTMINNIIGPFKPVLEIFGTQFTEEGKSKNGVNRKTDTITNIIKF